MGKVLAQLLGIFAEFERARMAGRRADAAAKIRSPGYWGGGQLPYGYRAVKHAGQHELEPDPDQAAIIRELADAIVNGKSMRAGCAALNARGVVTAKGCRWDASSVASTRCTCTSVPVVATGTAPAPTFAEYWGELDDAQRHAFLLDNGVTASVAPGHVDQAPPAYTAEAYDANARYTVWVSFTGLATLLGA